MISVQSERLSLVPLDHSLLQIWKTSGRTALERSLAIQPNVFQLEPFYEKEMNDALHNFWLPQTHKFPLDFCWYTNWEIIFKPSSCSVGGIGFSGLPNNEGKTEIGYAMDQKFRNLGIAKEATTLLIQWAAQDPDLQYITAETPSENLPSQAVLLANGFYRTGQKSIFLDREIPLLIWEKQIKK